MGAKVPRGTVFGLCATLVECSGDLPLPSLFDLAPPILNLRGQHMKLAVVADVRLLPPPLQAAMEQPDKFGMFPGGGQWHGVTSARSSSRA